MRAVRMRDCSRRQILGAFDPEVQARVQARRERIQQEVLESSDTL